MLLLAGRRARGLLLLLQAHRISMRLQPTGEPTRTQRAVEALLRLEVGTGVFPRLALAPDGRFDAELEWRAIVLKAPRHDAQGEVLERGVLLVTFTHIFGVLPRLLDLARLAEGYTLVLEPSWSGYAIAEVLQFAELVSHPVFIQATEERDFRFLQRIDARLVPLPFGASDWVDDRVFLPAAAAERRFDAGYIGFWGAVKRHHALFRALRQMGDPSFRVALIGGAWEGTAEEVAGLARWYGVLQQLAFFQGLRPDEVSRVIGACKVSILLSRKEGSNRGLFESMLSGTPVLLLQENIGVRKEYVNDRTGRIVPETALADALAWFRHHWSEFAPREWALEHIAPVATTARLNAALRARARDAGEPWTADCVAKTNRPEVTYYHPGDAQVLPSIASLLERYRHRP